MTIETKESAKGGLSVCGLDQSETIHTASDFLDVLVNCPTNTVVLKQEHLSPDFFDLKTRLAGDCLQKVSNYRKRLVIVGDFSNLTSQSLRDFIYESNQTGQVVFAADLASAIGLLR